MRSKPPYLTVPSCGVQKYSVSKRDDEIAKEGERGDQRRNCCEFCGYGAK